MDRALTALTFTSRSAHSAAPARTRSATCRCDAVVCPLHSYAFSLADGSCHNGDYAVRTYTVREEAGEIVVECG